MLKRPAVRLVIICVVALIVSAASCSLLLRKDGLFNNEPNILTATESHERAWKEAGLGPIVERQELVSLLDQHGADCITEEADWRPVNMKRPLQINEYAALPIACHFRVRGRWPQRFPETYTWAIILRPVTGDQLAVIRISRQTFAD